jgi:hypothetical protein
MIEILKVISKHLIRLYMALALALILVTSTSNYMGVFVLASPTSAPPGTCTTFEVLDPNTGKCRPMSAADAAKKFGACTEFECVLRTPLPPGGEEVPPDQNLAEEVPPEAPQGEVPPEAPPEPADQAPDGEGQGEDQAPDDGDQGGDGGGGDEGEGGDEGGGEGN